MQSLCGADLYRHDAKSIVWKCSAHFQNWLKQQFFQHKICLMIDKREITPELLARLTVVLFQKISIRDVLENRIRFDQLSAKDLARLMLKDTFFSRSQSMDGCESLAHSVIDFVTQKTRWQNGGHEEYPNRLNVLSLIHI